ncbi:putative histidinol-phosphatase [Alcanivorax sp. S71-1-4]|uniref:D-glycero-beta-D-manno-heptose 1,7-bisphosphate 7-phosphatase n=1 Tax=Alcanivorax sp. S71-1-4 TaxID=1177159 RepID=UPI001357069B|nr:D-glycero-beta-D-manno-heptose 1,7-bisphosphate 7-phosphatase [Alcanivorax sp. S71-1-4]KAF0809589.1 putative histidinol-phosphatase [Alcanivorax sp. S71-1-4]
MTDANRLVILDRDGVINEDSDDYIKSPEEWIAIAGSADAIARLNQAGYTVVVATNQSGVGRGYYDLATLDAIHAKMHHTVESAGGHIDGVFFCPHAPDDHCDCRKPRPGLLDQIRDHLGYPVAGAWLVGDSLRDLECGLARDCRPVLVRSGKGTQTLAKGLPAPLSDIPVFDDLATFVHYLMS